MNYRVFGGAFISVMLVAAGNVSALEGDVANGEKVFKKCKACHVVDSDKNKVGPTLANVVGRKAAAVESFTKYSPAMIAKAEEGLVWDEANLDAYLTKPKDFIPKTRMAFPGLKKEQDRADIIAYLKSFTQ